MLYEQGDAADKVPRAKPLLALALALALALVYLYCYCSPPAAHALLTPRYLLASCCGHLLRPPAATTCCDQVFLVNSGCIES